MRGRGEAILEYLVKRAEGAQDARVIARAIGHRDGRAVARPLEKLVDAGLLVRTRGKFGLYYPTTRGRELDRILDEITVARGGTFRGTREAGISFSESYALRF